MTVRRVVVGLWLCGGVWGEDGSVVEYRLSIGAVVASASLDTASSLDKPERNPLLRNASGNFGVRGVGVKIGITGGVVGIG